MAKTKEELLAARAARDDARKAADEAHALLVLQLEDKFESELGPRGKAFEIMNESNTNGEGPIVVKAPTFASYKLWKSKDGDTPEDALQFVRPCVVFPDSSLFDGLVDRRPLFVSRVVSAVLALAGSEAAAARGKF